MTRIQMIKSLALLLAALHLVSCAGYRLGNQKPAALVHVTRIAVPMVKNLTQHPRAEAIATSALVNAMVQDGTYRVANREGAEAVLECTLAKISYQTVRGTRFDTLRPEELKNVVTLNWQLVDAKNPLKVLSTGNSVGTSQLFASSNLQTARNGALPEALERASEALVSSLANGY